MRSPVAGLQKGRFLAPLEMLMFLKRAVRSLFPCAASFTLLMSRQLPSGEGLPACKFSAFLENCGSGKGREHSAVAMIKTEAKRALIAASVTLAALLFVSTLISSRSVSIAGAVSGALPGIQLGPAPWPAETDHLAARLRAIGLPALSAEGSALHIHQHLDIIVNGTPADVPAGIGINETARFISPLHTHDETGVIHVESDDVRDFTLGDFFDVWGVRLTTKCVGGYCSDRTKTLKIFSNGKPVGGDPRALVLKSHQEIALVYGQARAARSVPSSYRFAPGL